MCPLLRSTSQCYLTSGDPIEGRDSEESTSGPADSDEGLLQESSSTRTIKDTRRWEALHQHCEDIALRQDQDPGNERAAPSSLAATLAKIRADKHRRRWSMLETLNEVYEAEEAESAVSTLDRLREAHKARTDSLEAQIACWSDATQYEKARSALLQTELENLRKDSTVRRAQYDGIVAGLETEVAHAMARIAQHEAEIDVARRMHRAEITTLEIENGMLELQLHNEKSRRDEQEDELEVLREENERWAAVFNREATSFQDALDEGRALRKKAVDRSQGRLELHIQRSVTTRQLMQPVSVEVLSRSSDDKENARPMISTSESDATKRSDIALSTARNSRTKSRKASASSASIKGCI